MTVIVKEKCRVAWEYGVTELAEGQEIPPGELANYLLSTGAPVESTEDLPQPQPEQSGVPRPAVNAAKADWVAHVADLHSLEPDEVNQLTKPALIDLADSPPEAPNAAPAGDSV
jgi:hypothetical protein